MSTLPFKHATSPQVAILAALAIKVTDPERGTVLPAYTVHALAREIGANPSRVEAELRTLKRAGKVVVRVTRANDVLYKLADKQDAQWQAQQGIDRPPYRTIDEQQNVLHKRSRKLGGRHIHITGWF